MPGPLHSPLDTDILASAAFSVQAASNSIIWTSERSTTFFAWYRSSLYCIVSQLSGERPSAFDKRSAISGLIALRWLMMRVNVEGEYRKDNRPVSLNRASMNEVRAVVVGADRGPRGPNFVATAIGNSAIGAVRLFSLAKSEREDDGREGVRAYARQGMASVRKIRFGAHGANRRHQASPGFRELAPGPFKSLQVLAGVGGVIEVQGGVDLGDHAPHALA